MMDLLLLEVPLLSAFLVVAVAFLVVALLDIWALLHSSNTLVKNALDEPDTVVDWRKLVDRLPLVDDNAVIEMWNEAVLTTPGKLDKGGREPAHHPVLVHILRIITSPLRGACAFTVGPQLH